MKCRLPTISAALLLSVLSLPAAVAEEKEQIILERAGPLELMKVGDKYVTCVSDSVIFRTSSGKIYCDSAFWTKGESIRLNGHVRINDTTYILLADSAFYDVINGQAEAWGERVELWSYRDSIYAVGPYAFYDKERKYFFMDERPLMYLKYPDTANMIEVLADSIEYTSHDTLSLASGRGDVIISSAEFSSSSGQAIMNLTENRLDLRDEPAARRGNSEINGKDITVWYEDDVIHLIEVVDSTQGKFKEAVDTLDRYFDESILSGHRIEMRFDSGRLCETICIGQAYSWYYPSPCGGREFHENSVSGDTIRFHVMDEKLEAIDVSGGAIGTYITGKRSRRDTVVVSKPDTVDYNAQFIHYDMQDSLITLREGAGVTSGAMSLSAYRILFDTRRGVIEATSASAMPDSTRSDSGFVEHLQPNTIPVILGDKDDVVYGDYLEYSIETEKGRVVRSKSAYEAGYYYGRKLFREQKHIFYVDDGRYTTCDLDEPHYHFRSRNLKLIQGDKLIARPVVFYLGRVPLMAFPYYVFPLKRGRHSGFLPFTFGNFERGVRYVRNVGYYWAVSEYCDWLGSLDYYDNRNTFTINSRLTFTKRYVIENTYLNGSFTRVWSYNTFTAAEYGNDRWTINGSYNHVITPTLKLAATGSFQSDKSYFTEYSPNLEERLNREVRSKAILSKKFGNGASVTTTINHTVNLDLESRTDNIPSIAVSLPTIYPFGNGKRNAEGKLEQKWYHDFKLRFSPSLLNFSSRQTPFYLAYDTTFVDSTYDDTAGVWIPEEDTVVTIDTVDYRSRKKFVRLNASPTIYLPGLSLGDYLNLTPSFGYQEVWFRIFQTDQSDTAGVGSGAYRTYSWRAALTASTRLYGMVSPRLLGLKGLRHVVTPSVSYAYSPDINRNPEVKRYAGGGAGSTKSQVMSFGLSQDFHAKVGGEETKRNIELFTLRSGFSYNFEADSTPLSNMTTTFQSKAVKNLDLYAKTVHSFYEPGMANLDFWSPYRMSFTFRTRLDLKGIFGLFDEPTTALSGADSSSGGSSTEPGKKSKPPGGGWRCSLNYRYGESGREESWRKTADDFFAQIDVSFKLTHSTTVTYAQRYDFRRDRTINASISIVRKIHCWSGSLYWVPVGSNRGFGFKLFVTELPEIKIDNGHDDFLTGLQRYH